MNRKIWTIGLVGALLISLHAAADAADKTFFIKGSNVNKLGTNVTIGNDNIVFSKTLYLPGTSTQIDDFAINDGVVYDAGSLLAGRNIQIDINVGQSINVTAWTPSVGPNNYYGKKSLSMNQANFDDSALTWNWNGFALDYKAAAPYQPTVTSFAESTTSYTNGDDSVSALTVSSAAGSGSDGLREITDRAWKMWVATDAEPGAAMAGATAATLTLSSSQVSSGVTYSFKVANGNQWDGGSPTWSNVFSYTVAGGPATDDQLSVSLTKQTDGFGINSFGMPFASNYLDGSPINNIRELIDAINNVDGEGYVATIGFWDGAQEVGFTLNDSGAVISKVNTDQEPEAIALVRGRGYQVSVTESKTLVIKNTP